MSEKIHYFKIGLFTVFTLGLFVVGLIVFGAGEAFKDDSIPVETYFNQSVQGLDIGSPVKFNGVKVGDVKEIVFAKDLYPERTLDGKFEDYYKGVIVKFKVKENYFPQLRNENAQEQLDRLVRDEGLRVRLNAIGITGLVYLEMSFWNPSEVPPPLALKWKPDGLYVPSAPSVINRLATQLDKFLNVMDAHGYSMIENVSLSTRDLPEVMSKLNTTLTHASVVAANLEMITATAKKYPSQLIFGQEPPKSRYDR